MKIKNYICIILLFSICIFSGCGNGNSSSEDITPVTNTSPYEGSWQGVWKAPTATQSGLLTGTIAPSGQITGTSANYNANITGTFSGTVNDSGAFSGAGIYPSNTSILDGTFQLSNGTLILNMNETINNIKSVDTSTLHLITSINNPYAGNWSGTWSMTIPAENGTMNLIISSDCTISGTSYSATYNVTSTVLGTIDNKGNFSCKSQYPGQLPTALHGNLGAIANNSISTNFMQTASGIDFTGSLVLSK